MEKIYKIKFNKTSEGLNKLYDKFDEIDKDQVDNLDAYSFFDYEKNGYICFLMVEKFEMSKYTEILDRYDIFYELTDYSDDILSGKFDVFIELGDKVIEDDVYSDTNFSFFVEDVEDWVLDNLEMDMVLDKISDVGMDKLTPIEKYFLKTYNK